MADIVEKIAAKFRLGCEFADHAVLLRSEWEELSDYIRALEANLTESRANDMTAMGWLADARMASGDDGRRMLPEFIEYLKELREKAVKK